jgi:A/G-specific adenine glycosylase
MDTYSSNTAILHLIVIFFPFTIMNDTPEYWNKGEKRINTAFKNISNPPDLSGKSGRTPKWILLFQSHIWSFYNAFGRDFTWRNQITPYRVLVSESMLQQTQTARVKEKFPRFIKRFPSLKALSQAKRSQVIEEWSGLGYNRRAKFLHETAIIIYQDFSGRIPKDRDRLLALPGIGSGTASAIRAFAFNLPDTLIETNIRTVFRRIFFPEDENISDTRLLLLIEMTVDQVRPREWYYALMDYGVFLKQNGYQVNSVFKGYRPQSRFEGSTRQVRGEIIKFLIEENGRAKKEKVIAHLDVKFQGIHDVLIILEKLEKDGLIRVKPNSISMA